MGVGRRLLGAHLGLPPPSGTVLFAEIAALAACLGMFALTRRTEQDPAELLDRGLVYEVGMGFLIAVTYHCWPAPPGQMPKGWSPVAVWLIAFALLVPATRGKNLLATVATALMDPLGLTVSFALGTAAPPALAVDEHVPADRHRGRCRDRGLARRERAVRSRPAARGSSGATGSSRCSATAAWVKCGAPSTACSRATRRSSSCAAAPTRRGAR